MAAAWPVIHSSVRGALVGFGLAILVVVCAYPFIYGRSEKPHSPIEEKEAATVTFVSEEHSALGADYERAVVPVLQEHRIRKAFLVRVIYESGERSVALAVCAPENPGLTKQLAAKFQGLAGRKAFVDIIYIDAEEESAAARVARPFFLLGSV